MDEMKRAMLSLQVFPTVSVSLVRRLIMSPVLLLSKYSRGTRFIFLDRSSRMTLAIFSEEADIRYS